MKDFKGEPIRDAKLLGTGSMLLMGLQHMVAMFGATVLVPILVGGFFKDATGEPITQGMNVAVTLFCAGFGTLVFHVLKVQGARFPRLLLRFSGRLLHSCKP